MWGVATTSRRAPSLWSSWSTTAMPFAEIYCGQMALPTERGGNKGLVPSQDVALPAAGLMKCNFLLPICWLVPLVEGSSLVPHPLEMEAVIPTYEAPLGGFFAVRCVVVGVVPLPGKESLLEGRRGRGRPPLEYIYHWRAGEKQFHLIAPHEEKVPLGDSTPGPPPGGIWRQRQSSNFWDKID